MKNVMAEVRDIITAHREDMTRVEISGLYTTADLTSADLSELKWWLESEQRKARKMAAKTQDWNNARPVYKVAYLIHDKRRYELEHAVAEVEQDLKTLKSRLNPTAADYDAHPWNIDVSVYIYCNSRNADGSENDDASDISDVEVEAYMEAIKKCLRGEFAIELDCCGDRGFSFYADAADEKIWDLVDGLEKRGCVIDYNDWDYIHETGNEEETDEEN